MLEMRPDCERAAPICQRKLAALSSARSNALSAPNVPMRWTNAAPIAAANCSTGRRGQQNCLRKISRLNREEV
jgi:hypothetical protein